MKKSMKKFLIGSGIAAAGLALGGAAVLVVTDFLLDVALDRKEPARVSTKTKERFTGFTDFEGLCETLDADARILEAGEHRVVRMTARDSVELVGHLYVVPEAKRTILAMHGWRSGWSRDFGIIADFWAQSGCNVLYAEQRAQGESGGEHMGFGMLERLDCVDWIRWLTENGFADLPIYAAGVSMGAATVLMAAGEDLPPQVRGIIADCGFTSPEAIWKHVARKNIRFPYTALQSALINELCRRKIQLGATEYTTVKALRKARVPVLFVHGSDDKFVPIEMTFENYKACAAPKRLLVVPGAEHGMSYLTDPAAYQAALRDFWQEFD